MRKYILFFILSIVCLAWASDGYCVATKMYGRDALLGGTKSCANILTPADGTLCQVVDSSHYYWLYIFDTGSSETETDPWYADPGDTTTGDWVLIYNPGNGYKSLANANETQVPITVKDWYQNKEWDNQAQYAGEADWKLPDYDYKVTRTITTEEAQIIELCPPTDETMFLNGSTLDQNDCVDLDDTVGSVVVVKRMQNAAGTWFYNVIDVLGTATDTGAGD